MFWLAFLPVVVLSAQVAPAEPRAPSDEPLEEIVVYGRRLREVPYPEVTDATSVVTRDDIERAQASTLADVLRERAGVDVRSIGGPGTQTTISIRGSEADHVQVLIDGVRVDSSTQGFFNWVDLTSHDIERVEVFRGPQSTLYGANAMAGVIQVFTRRGDGPLSATASGGLGNEGQRSAGLRISGSTASGARYFLSALHASIDGVSAFLPDPVPSPRPEVDPYRNSTFSARVELPLGDGSASLFSRYVTAHAELDNATRDNRFFDQDSLQWHFGADAQVPIADWWTTRIQYSQNDDELEGRDPNLGFNNFDVESRSRLVTWTHDLSWDDVDLLTGVDYEVERGRNQDAGVDQSSRQTGVFARGSYAIGPLVASAGVRHESSSRTESQTTYQLGARLILLDGLDLLANYGTGFRPPTLNELFFRDPFAEGNPDLEPEKSRGGDVGLRLRRASAAGWSAEAEVWAFLQTYRNLIEFRLAPDFILRPVNVESARSRGVEVKGRLEWNGWWLAAEYTVLRARADGFRLRRRADHAGRVSVGGRWRDVTAEVVSHLVGRSFSRSRERDRVGGYRTVDVNLGYEVSESFAVRAHVHNVGDRDYREVFNRGTLGRTYFVTLEGRY